MTDTKTTLAIAAADIQAAAAALDIERAEAAALLDNATRQVVALTAKVAALKEQLAALDPWTAIDNTGQTVVNALVQARLDAGDNMPAGRYLIDPTAPLLFTRDTDGATNPDGTPATFLIALPSATARDCVAKVMGVGTLVRNLHVVGDRMAKAYTAGSTNEWGYGVQVLEGASIENVYAELCTGDGFGILGRGVTVTNCHADRNRRQGLSGFDCDGLRIVGGSYTNTGTVTVDGVTDLGAANGPWAGIDIEPDRKTGQPAPNANVLIQGARITGNRGAGVLGYLRAEVGGALNITVDDCEIHSNMDGVRGEAVAGLVTMLVTRNDLALHKGAAVRANSGSKITVASGANTANTIAGMTSRTPFTMVGIVTPYDLKAYGSGVIVAGQNNYR